MAEETNKSGTYSRFANKLQHAIESTEQILHLDKTIHRNNIKEGLKTTN